MPNDVVLQIKWSFFLNVSELFCYVSIDVTRIICCLDFSFVDVAFMEWHI